MIGITVQIIGITVQIVGIGVFFVEIDDLEQLFIFIGIRISRSLQDLIESVTLLEARGVQLNSLHESIDTASSSGKLIFHLFGALAEFERNLIKERTLAGLQAARARGRRGEDHLR